MSGEKTMHAKAPLVILFLGLIFGSAFLYVKVLVEVLTPLQLTAARLTLGAAAVLLVMGLQRKLSRPSIALLGGVAVLGLLDSVVPYLLIGWAEKSINGGVAAVLMSTMPLFTALFASVTLPDERLSAGKLMGIGVGLTGVIVLAGPEALDPTHGVTVGHTAVIGAAACYGIAAVYARVLLRSQDLMDVTAWKLALASVIAIAISGAIDGAPRDVSLGGSQWLALFLLGVVSTGLGRSLHLWLIAAAGSVRSSLVTYIIPVSGLFLGWAILGEEITAGTLAGLVLIVGGVASVMYGPAVARGVSRWRPQAIAPEAQAARV